MLRAGRIQIYLSLFLSLALAGCSLKLRSGAQATSEAEAALPQRLSDARARAAAALDFLIANGDPDRGLCDVRYCGAAAGNTFICSTLSDLASHEENRLYLDSVYLSHAELVRQRAALAQAQMATTDETGPVQFNGQTQQAYTTQGTVTFYRPWLVDKSDDELMALWLHEISHIENFLDLGPVGPMSSGRLAIDSRASCEVAFWRKHQQASPDLSYPPPPTVLFSQNFTAPVGAELSPETWFVYSELSPAHLTEKGLLPDGPLGTRARLNNLQVENVRIRATLDFSRSPSGSLYVTARDNTYFNHYDAYAYRNYEQYLVGIGYGSDLAETHVPAGTDVDFVFELNGPHLRVFFNGLLTLETQFTTSTGGQSVSFILTDAYLKNLSLEAL